MADDKITALAHAVEKLEKEVTYLRDLEEIRKAIYGYARGFDRVDESLLNQIYHDDAFDNHGNWHGDRDQTLKILLEKGRSGRVQNAMHHLGNMLIDLKGDVAHVETYFVSYAKYAEGGKTYTRSRAGRYLDRFEKRDGRWRVKNRQVVDDWSRIDEVVAFCPDAGKNEAPSRRDSSDASYRLEGYMADWAR